MGAIEFQSSSRFIERVEILSQTHFRSNASQVPSEYVAGASGFYENLLLTRRYWQRTLAEEGLAELSLPSAEGCVRSHHNPEHLRSHFLF